MEESLFLAYSPWLAQFAFLYNPDHLPRSDSTYIHPDSSSSIIYQELLYRSAYRPICWDTSSGEVPSFQNTTDCVSCCLPQTAPGPGLSLSLGVPGVTSVNISCLLCPNKDPSPWLFPRSDFLQSTYHLLQGFLKFFLPGIPSAQEIFRQFWFILVYKIHIQSQYLLIISQKRNVFQNNGERQGCR